MVVPRNTPAGARLGSLFQKCPIPAGVCFTFSKSAQFPAGFALLFSKVPNSRRGLLYFFQKCPIPAGVCFTFSKSAQFPPGFALLFPKVPNSRRGLLYFFQKCPIPGGSRVAFAKVAQFSAGLGSLLQKLREPGCGSNEWRPTPVRYELHLPLAGKDLSEVFGGDIGGDSAVVSHADRAALFGDDDDDGVRLLRHAQSGAVAQAHLLR